MGSDLAVESPLVVGYINREGGRIQATPEQSDRKQRRDASQPASVHRDPLGLLRLWPGSHLYPHPASRGDSIDSVFDTIVSRVARRLSRHSV